MPKTLKNNTLSFHSFKLFTLGYKTCLGQRNTEQNCFSRWERSESISMKGALIFRSFEA